MKRLRRWLFNLAAGVSLVLCLATVGMWVRGRFVCDQFVVDWYEFTMVDDAGLPNWDGPASGNSWMITLGDGGILVVRSATRPRNYSPQPSPGVHWRWQRHAPTSGGGIR